MHTRSQSTVALAVVCMVAAAAGCSGGSTADSEGGGDLAKAVGSVTDAQLKGTTIRYSVFFGNCSATVGSSTDVSKAVGECATISTLVNKFNAENKWGIKVELLGSPQWATYYDNLNAAFAGGNPPDVAIMHGGSLVDYAKRGLIIPLDDLANITKIDFGDAVPAARTAIGYNGVDYAIPFDVNALLAHVNVDIFKRAGLVTADGAPKLPSTPDEFLAAAQKVRAATGKPFAAIARVNDRMGVNVLMSLMEQQGGGVLNADGTKSTLDSPQARTALDFMNHVFDGGYANGSQTYDGAQQSFLNGDAAILVNGTWVVDELSTKAKFKYVTRNFPTLYGKPAVWSENHTWVIPKQPKADPVKYRAALEFISFLYEHDMDWALGTGHVSTRKSVLNSATYKSAPQRAGYAETGLSIAHPVPHIAHWSAVEKAWIAAIESIWFQNASVDSALKQGAANIDAVLATG
jgi:multiple sugar transport system substrate-binding protein